MKHLERRLAGPARAHFLSRTQLSCLRRTLALASLFVFVASAIRSAEAQDSTTETSERLRGMVVNSVTHQPVPRALVSSPDSRFATLTDNEGRFEFTLPHAADNDNGQIGNVNRPVALLARKPGFLTDTAPQDLSTLSPEQSLTLTLVPEALIVGKVTLPNSEATANIFLQLYRRQVQDGAARWFAAGGTQSRFDGEFRFADLPAGTYKLLTREQLDRDPAFFDRGQQYGYPPAYGQNAPDFDSAGTIRVTPGMTGGANLSLTRKPYYGVHIPVANLAPDTGVNVVVFPAGHSSPGYSMGYNNREQAIEGLLPDGSYTVEASAYSAGQNTGTGSMTIAVNSAPVRGPVMTLAPNSPIRVEVKEEFTSADNPGAISINTRGRSVTLHGPRRYLNVLLEPADDYERGGVASLRGPSGPDDEALMIEPTRPGRYWVRAITSRGYVASLRSANIDLRYAPLTVAAGGSTSPIEITMRDDTAEIDGTVEGIAAPSPSLNAAAASEAAASFSGPVATPATPAHIYFIPLSDGSGLFAEAWTSLDGSFNSPPLAPGAYRVVAFDRPQSDIEYRNPEATREYEGKGPAVRLAGGQKENVRLQLVTAND